MPPLLAGVICYSFVGYLYWIDHKKGDNDSISWVPMAWVFLAGSRFASSWISLGAPTQSLDDYAEGSPIDRAVFLTLIICGVIVLARRSVRWGLLLGRNKWLVSYFLFCLISIVWAPEKFVLFKRWIKELGNPIMALVLLTESRPYKAVGTTLKRLSFFFLPVSVLFVKYYPELGRGYHRDGSPMYTGIGHQKNDLGLMCLTSGLFFAWKLIQNRRGEPRVRWYKLIEPHEALLMAMLAWLLTMSDSQTSFACLMVVVGLFAIGRIPMIATKPARIIPFLAISGVAYAILDSAFNVKDMIFLALGREPTLTGRTEIWDVVLSLQVNPIVGAGFMSFWTGDRLEPIWKALGTRGLNQAHNGYLEQYLNLGYVGVGFIVIMLLQGLFRVWRQLRVDASSAMLRLVILIIAALYNYSEASFYGMSNIWLLMLVACIDVSPLHQAQEQSVATKTVPALAPPPAWSAHTCQPSTPRFQRSGSR